MNTFVVLLPEYCNKCCLSCLQ